MVGVIAACCAFAVRICKKRLRREDKLRRNRSDDNQGMAFIQAGWLKNRLATAAGVDSLAAVI